MNTIEKEECVKLLGTSDGVTMEDYFNHIHIATQVPVENIKEEFKSYHSDETNWSFQMPQADISAIDTGSLDDGYHILGSGSHATNRDATNSTSIEDGSLVAWVNNNKTGGDKQLN